MTEPTSAEKNRVVAERWLGYPPSCNCGESSEHGWDGTHSGKEWGPPDIPNDPMAADALMTVLDTSGCAVSLDAIGDGWHVEVLTVHGKGCGEAPDWKLALRDAAYEAAMIERSEA